VPEEQAETNDQTYTYLQQKQAERRAAHLKKFAKVPSRAKGIEVRAS